MSDLLDGSQVGQHVGDRDTATDVASLSQVDSIFVRLVASNNTDPRLSELTVLRRSDVRAQ